jgi:hypothetical protein
MYSQQKVILLILLSSSLAFASGDVDQKKALFDQEKAEVILEAQLGPLFGIAVGVRWDFSGAEPCQAFQTNSGGPYHWQNVSKQTCLDVRKKLNQKSTELSSEVIRSENQENILLFGNMSVLMNVSGNKIMTAFANSERCDASFKNCKKDDLPASVDVAVEIRKQVAKVLGKLPPKFGRD